MLKKINNILDAALEESKLIKTVSEIEEYERKYLGRKSELNILLRELKDLPVEERKEVGKRGNEIKEQIQQQIQLLTKNIAQKEYKANLKKDRYDITATVKGPSIGSLHPITKEREEITRIFNSMGFVDYVPNLIDDEYHNFTSLNIPENHPAKDMWDTLWTDNDQILVTHTSSMQNRIIRNTEPPVRAIVTGKCFRNESTDRTHDHTFNQIEGIYVDKNIKLSDLLGVLKTFLNEYYGMEVETKIQPTYFPFVEPGMEIMMNMNFFLERLGKKTSGNAPNWIEVIPCGMIHPYVIKEAGLDPEVYSGFAWGLGLERLIMLKYGIDDLRYFHSGKLDFVKQFI